MPASADRPLLFLDVDGPLIPFGAPQLRIHEHPDNRSASQAGSNPLLARIDPLNGTRLSALPCDLVWATTWMADANELIAPILGLPELPVVDWPDPEEDGPLHWKTRGLVQWAAGRPFVWVDDEISDADRLWVSAHHGRKALLHRVDPRRGLTDADFTVIADWLAQL
ncbi:HAD domain-containing protein [Planotetraspora kaengkrachanensis]|uniref:Secreted protein n=1 Tax=Planotetraspora kaengkrachanensis TaxID=575193 RepID=A0A8J3PTU8_9ACTN|nr:HAD domain-containing protein [Planotetraspora kaengkrachanensis]GIG80929.1 hypothetical protein Pka01_40560 [Planotetraspora kaengkrachanensis]